MRHYQPLQRESDRRWDFVCTYDHEHQFSVGYCTGWHDLDEAVLLNNPQLAEHIERLRPWKHKFHTDGHPHPLAAAECFRDFLLDSALRLYAPAQAGGAVCMRCGTLTEISARVEPRYGYFPLCHKHMTRREVERLFAPSVFYMS